MYKHTHTHWLLRGFLKQSSVTPHFHINWKRRWQRSLVSSLCSDVKRTRWSWVFLQKCSKISFGDWVQEKAEQTTKCQQVQLQPAPVTTGKTLTPPSPLGSGFGLLWVDRLWEEPAEATPCVVHKGGWEDCPRPMSHAKEHGLSDVQPWTCVPKSLPVNGHLTASAAATDRYCYNNVTLNKCVKSNSWRVEKNQHVVLSVPS